MNEHACLIDGTAYLFRGYYSVRPVHAADGTPVNAVLGLGNALARLLRDRDPSHVAVAFDAGRYTFRHRIDPAYKANRGDPPEDLVPQFALAQQLTEAMGLATIGVPDFEADDVLATLTTISRESALDVVLVSGDKDLGQLLEPGVRLFDLARAIEFGAEDLPARMGVRADQLVDLLALMGDSSDNIPGVRGVGPKAASALLGHFDSLEAIYASLEEVETLSVRGARSLRRKLEEFRADAERSRELATVRRDVPLGLEVDDLRWEGADPDALVEFTARWSLGGLADRVRWLED